ncbi:putative acetyltransferase [Mobilisporobacter senegalensis]|uniref:Putative acetyltransferase n=1 Tax=Mobilisporobacter senegalensis TaxID=1329262 RepID=A0A3N1XMK6_9FIRM|nr:GNAT family N-acetyltransferase [Mobilisporobacter senegalensis]ROR27371.1 putative acetyltransferase [Mobilisporobacter senegalensis]
MEDNIKLIKANGKYKEQYIEMIKEWMVSKEDLIPWSLNLDYSDFDTMLRELDQYEKGIELPKGFVSSSSYWLIKDDKQILGALDIRHRLNENLAFRGGHIGYGIRPGARRQGYATKMLSLALEECKLMGLNKVLITCDKNNMGSAKTIMNNHGVLESEDMENGEIFQRYWIDL